MIQNAEIGRASLFGKLDPLLFGSLESATALCKLRGNPYVELVHWLHAVLQQPDSDLLRVLRHYGLPQEDIARDLVRALDALPRGSTSITDMSAHVESSAERAWVYATLLYGQSVVRSGHWLVALGKTPGLRNVLAGASRALAQLPWDTLARDLPQLVEGSAEQAAARPMDTTAGPDRTAAEGHGDPAAANPKSALARFAVDLTGQARKGKLDPVTGRDAEIRQMIDVLMRRRQNNPLLTGEAGVGKTAVVEGLALRIAADDVPAPLRDVAIHALDVGMLQAGAGARGEFEQRLRQVIDEVNASTRPIVLFIDEIHTLIGAGGQAGTGDAANLLKPALARGNLRTIGATTWSEYKRYIEKDAALTRRFHAIQVLEPEEAKAVAMLRSMVGVLEKHHGVHIAGEALEAAVQLSRRYIPARQLPDKAVSLLDTACARVAMSQQAMPTQLEQLHRQRESREIEREILLREELPASAIEPRLQALVAAEARLTEEIGQLHDRWQQELALMARIQALRRPAPEAGELGSEAASTAPAIETEAGTETEGGAASEPGIATLHEALAELQRLQAEDPLVQPSVTAQAVAGIVAEWTGIPVGKMLRDEVEATLGLAERLARRVVGQDHALEAIARRIRSTKAGVEDPSKPSGVFLLCGPSGVGKTETALALADMLYGGEDALITINMSEYQESHTVSSLKGAPPGYVGYGEGGVLTEAVRRRPYSVVLLDEVEKAHPDVHEVFFQVFDKGWMEDGEGRYIDFRNTVIILTSNVGTDLLMGLCADPALLPSIDDLNKALRTPLLKVFPPAFLGRLLTVPYLPLSPAMLESIVNIQFQRIADRLQRVHGIVMRYDQSARQLVIDRCSEPESGGRAIDAILTTHVLPQLATEILSRMVDKQALQRVTVTASNQAFDFLYE
ncbi:type VI secretion system ATPase TssH [Sphingomonas sp. NCPPB 2930]